MTVSKGRLERHGVALHSGDDNLFRLEGIEIGRCQNDPVAGPPVEGTGQLQLRYARFRRSTQFGPGRPQLPMQI